MLGSDALSDARIVLRRPSSSARECSDRRAIPRFPMAAAVSRRADSSLARCGASLSFFEFERCHQRSALLCSDRSLYRSVFVAFGDHLYLCVKVWNPNQYTE